MMSPTILFLGELLMLAESQPPSAALKAYKSAKALGSVAALVVALLVAFFTYRGLSSVKETITEGRELSARSERRSAKIVYGVPLVVGVFVYFVAAGAAVVAL